MYLIIYTLRCNLHNLQLHVIIVINVCHRNRKSLRKFPTRQIRVTSLKCSRKHFSSLLFLQLFRRNMHVVSVGYSHPAVSRVSITASHGKVGPSLQNNDILECLAKRVDRWSSKRTRCTVVPRSLLTWPLDDDSHSALNTRCNVVTSLSHRDKGGILAKRARSY